MAEGPSLRRRAATSVGWSMVRFGGDQIFNFIVFATLTRLLAPQQFGVFILALGVAEIGKVIAQGGLVNVLYQHEEITPQIGDTIFWTNVVAGLALALVCFALRHPLAAALGSPAAAQVIGVIGFVVPVASAGASHMARNLREFGYRALALRSLLAGVIGGGLAVWAAFAGWGVWALVVQRFATELIGTLIAWWSFRWVPGFNFSWSTLRRQLAMGGSIMASQLLLTGLGRVQDVIISRMIGLTQVGIYRTAWKSIEVISQGVITPFANVAAPTLLRLKHDMEDFRRGYLNLISASALISFPAIVGVGAIADQLVPLLYGQQWGASVPIARLLSLLVLPFALNFFVDPGLTVLGRSKVIAQLAFVQLLATIVMCTLAAPYGLAAFTMTYVGRAYLTMGLQLYLYQRETGVRATAVFRAVMPPLLASLGMAGVLWAARLTLPNMSTAHQLTRAFNTAVLVAIGAASYGVLITLFVGPQKRAFALAQARRLLRSRTPAMADAGAEQEL